MAVGASSRPLRRATFDIFYFLYYYIDMSTPDRFPGPSKKNRTTREIIDGMPTPANHADAFALFAALELEAMENGKSTPK